MVKEYQDPRTSQVKKQDIYAKHYHGESGYGLTGYKKKCTLDVTSKKECIN